jgi:putative sterol carrier protein
LADQHVFLSDGWIDAASAAYTEHEVTVGFKIKMNQIVTNCPFDDPEVQMFTDTSDGTMRTGKGSLEAPEVTLTTDWETARKIIVDQDQAAAMQAFMTGKIKVQGDPMKLMQMNAIPPTEAQKAAANTIKAMTA